MPWVSPPSTRVVRYVPGASRAEATLNRYFGQVRQPVTLLRTGGVWTSVVGPTAAQSAAAELVLQGGHWYWVTDATYAEIVGAGFSVNVHPSGPGGRTIPSASLLPSPTLYPGAN